MHDFDIQNSYHEFVENGTLIRVMYIELKVKTVDKEIKLFIIPLLGNTWLILSSKALRDMTKFRFGLWNGLSLPIRYNGDGPINLKKIVWQNLL